MSQASRTTFPGLLHSLFALLLLAASFVAAAQNRNLSASDARTPASGHGSVGLESRIALIVGNNAYSEAPLTASINDARAMANSLTDLGFKVTKLENVSRVAMARAIRAFVDDVARTGAVGLFYFAGHGAQARSKNFLIPVDADIQHEDDVELQGVDLQYMLDKFGDIRNGMNIIILDACRNNPFRRLKSGRSSGLAAVDGPPGTLVAFAAAPGQVARETTGGNGIYTSHILRNISKPGLPIEEVFKRIREGVLADTSSAQVPWENTSLVRDFYFLGSAPGGSFKPTPVDDEGSAWLAIENSKNIYDFVAFLRRFPNSRYLSDLQTGINLILSRLKPVPPTLLKEELPFLLNEAYGGYWIRPLNKYSAEFLGLSSTSGQLVSHIERGSAADRAGLRPGDVVLKVNGETINGMAEALALSKTILPGEYVEGVVWRDRKEITVGGIASRAPLERLLGRIAAEHIKRKDFARAKLFNEYLANVGDSVGQTMLGLSYLHGLGVTRNIKAAEALLLAAAKQGAPDAAAHLASIYINPTYDGRDDSAAFRWAKFSSDSGNAEGAVLLASAYIRGIGTEKNLQEGVRLARIGAEQGNAAGMHLLGVAYEFGVGGLARNIEEAKAWYSRSNALGNSAARAALQRIGAN